jgi:endogenous inhibitor of DNA gyrase (YacG/DUF329 family)
MAQNSEDLYDNMPCPDCGSNHLIQTSIQSEDLRVDGNGDPKSFSPRDSIDVIQLDCPECDKTLWEKDE